MPARVDALRGTAFLAGAILCLGAATGIAEGAGSTPTVLAAPPAAPDPAATWLFYLHGRIVQEQGRQAVSPDYGPYLYDQILARLAATGVTVVSEARPRGTEPEAYADRVASQVRALIAAGVPAARITVVGASMGAWLTLLVSHRLDLPGIGYVAMAGCGPESDRGFEGGLHGDVLSIYEAGDTLGQSCGALLARSPEIGRHAEIRLDTGLRHGFLYRPLAEWVDPAIAWARGRAAGPDAPGKVVHFSPNDSPTMLRDRLAEDATITELILAAGVYPGGLVIPAPRDPAARPLPLLIRPADGAEVFFDGSYLLATLGRVKGMKEVVSADPGIISGEPPAIFDPGARLRYTYAADAAAVERFPGTVVIDGGRLLLHPPGVAQRGGGPLRSLADQGLAIMRPQVTVRGIVFRNFLARAKWSAGVQAYADDVSIEDATVENAAIGVMVAGDRAAVLRLTGRDLGCGVYVSGAEARVEGNRLIKRRDSFQVPTYVQDDTGIQFYDTAHGGLVRGNLAVGFGTGLLYKAVPAPAWIEGNTFVGADIGVGLLAPNWDPGTVVRGNVVAGFQQPQQLPHGAERRSVGGNCYAPWKGGPASVEEPGGALGDPHFADAVRGDFRLGPGSACFAASSAGTGIGAFASKRSETPAAGDAAPGIAGSSRPAATEDAAAVPVEPGHSAGKASKRRSGSRGFFGRRASGPGGAAATPAPAGATAGAAADSAPGPVAAGAPVPAPHPPRDWHVAQSGRAGADGTAAEPLATIQEAVDRAGPGDMILVGAGLYADPVRFTRGGTAGKPITLRAATPGTVVLDGQRRHDVLVDLDHAPFVVLRDLEIRWYRTAGIRLESSHDVIISGCRIWNAHWGGTWPAGNGIQASQSQRLTAERNILFAQERGLFLYLSPGAVVRHNTAVGNLYGGVQFIFSLEGAVLRDNSLAFQGNDAMAIVETPAGRGLVARFDCDRNNYGMTLREQPKGTIVDRITPRPVDRHLLVPSKALVYYEEQPGSSRRFESLVAWRAFSGKDDHSIVADPLFVNSAARDFRLEPESPNRGAGTDGSAIGATE